MNLNESSRSASLPFYDRRKREVLEHVESQIGGQECWRQINSSYYEEDRKFMRFLIPPGKRVLELGCGVGNLLAAVEPAYGVGVDFSPSSIEKAKARHPELHFVVGDVEDPRIMSSIEGPF